MGEAEKRGISLVLLWPCYLSFHIQMERDVQLVVWICESGMQARSWVVEAAARIHMAFSVIELSACVYLIISMIQSSF